MNGSSQENSLASGGQASSPSRARERGFCICPFHHFFLIAMFKVACSVLVALNLPLRGLTILRYCRGLCGPLLCGHQAYKSYPLHCLIFHCFSLLLTLGLVGILRVREAVAAFGKHSLWCEPGWKQGQSLWRQHTAVLQSCFPGTQRGTMSAFFWPCVMPAPCYILKLNSGFSQLLNE